MSAASKLRLALILLAVLHGAVLLAGFLAPYDSAAQNRDLPFAPPSRLHFFDAQGNFHLRPFVYGWRPLADGGYEEDRSQTYALRFLVRGSDDGLTGQSGWQWRLFGVDEPGRVFLLGSDHYGRDLFSRFLHGGRISLLTGLLATCLSLAAGLVLGTLAGYYGRWLDELIMRGGELFLALPWLYLLFAIRAFLPLHISPTQAFLLLITVIGLVGWARPARLIRGVVLSAKEQKYVLAARGFGASDFYLLRRHIFPHVAGLLLTQAALLIPHYILAEVTLSFLGLGVGEPVPTWGTLLAPLQQYHVLASYWWMFLPGMGLVLVFLAYSVLANALHEKIGFVPV